MLSQCEAGSEGGSFGSLTVGCRGMVSGFDNQELPTRSQSSMHVTHETAGISSMMYHIDTQREIDLAAQVTDTKILPAADSCFNSLGKAGLICLPS